MLGCVFWRLGNPPIIPKEDKLISNGINRIESGQYMKAYRSIRRAASLNPSNPFTLELLDIVSLRWLPKAAPNISDPVATTNHLLKKYPESPYLKILGAEVLLSEGELEKATKLLTDVSASDPGIPQGWFALGTAQQAEGNIESAINSVQRAIDLKPQTQYFAKLGELYFENKNWESCLKNLYRLANEDRLRLSSRIVYLRCLLYSGDHKGAVEVGEALYKTLQSLERIPKSSLEKVNLLASNSAGAQLIEPTRELLMQYVEVVVDMARSLDDVHYQDIEPDAYRVSEALRPIIDYDLEQIR